ncbi:MAG TPA: PEP-CTERM sorting domain-containing protein [Rhodanobacter sp.]|nr:PEP-CTERM sorting domain-containing protein [Rhodanobacter sp.]
MGLVALGMDGTGACGGPMLSLTGYSFDCAATDNVQIPPAYANFPINTNLTSTGLSDRGESAHVGFYAIDSTQWAGINVTGGDSCGGSPGTCYVTIVSAATGGGGSGTSVPEPAHFGMVGLGLALMGLFAGLRRRRDKL